MSLTPQWLDELRSRVTLSTLIGRTVKVTRAGREYKACCPFHNEKTPSFTINDEKGFYHCFGCSAHGDAIRWMTDQRGLSFMDAVKELAAEAGMEVPAADPRAAKKAEEAASLRDVVQGAADWFTQQLGSSNGAPAREYLAKRGISEATRKAFGFGLAPESRSALKEALKKFPTAMLVESGMLIAVDDKEPYDRFRGRLMIPIRDARGRVIAFGGRILGDGEPKYLNSPDTPLFDKGRVLYNLDKASPASRQTNRIIVVEGYMDVIALAEAGIADAVAPLGTALTEAQLGLIWRMVDEPILCFDGDNAGTKAARRAANLAIKILPNGKTVKIAQLPPGQDPDDVVRSQGSQAFENLIRDAVPLSEFTYQSTLLETNFNVPEGRAKLLNSLTEIAESTPDRVISDQYKSWFKTRFYQDFGWNAKDRHTIYQSAIATSEKQNVVLYKSYVRSAFHAASRFPQFLLNHYESIGSIKMLDDKIYDDLKRWQDVICDFLFKNPGSDDDAIAQIVARGEFASIHKFDLQKDLRFSWNIEPELVQERLPKFINFLAVETDLNLEFERLDRDLINNFTPETYEAIQKRQQLLKAERSKLYGEALDWMD